MLLGQLSEEIGAKELTGGADTEIGGISADSKHVMQGDLFVCFCGEENDGHEFAAEAVAGGPVSHKAAQTPPLQTERQPCLLSKLL